MYDQEDYIWGTARDPTKLEQEERRKVEQRNYDRHLSDIQQLVKTPAGRRYIWSVLSLCGVMSASMRDNMYATAFREGQRDIGMKMLKDLVAANPESYDQMRRENASNEKSDELIIQAELQKVSDSND